jgi:hypothetical protein
MTEIQVESVGKLSKDLKIAAQTISLDGARILVSRYYQMQDDRKRAYSQEASLDEAGEPCSILGWLANQSETLEKEVAKALDAFSKNHPLGVWARSVNGIGPIIAAALLAYIRFEPWICVHPDGKANPRARCNAHEAVEGHTNCGTQRIQTAGAIWSYAGLVPGVKWEKGQLRPWNARLKTLCWKIGESFMKVSGNPDAYYGQVYAKRKLFELEQNELGAFQAQAEQKLKDFKIGKATEAYKWYIQGKLPPKHILERSKRYAVKLFLSHYHHVGYKLHFGVEPPMPYVIAQLGHAHYLPPPNLQIK